MIETESTGLLTLYSDVRAAAVHWLWYPFIASGKITLLQGDPGDGKSTMMMRLIAELSTGGVTPDGCPLGRPQRIIYQCSEDGVADTIKPRLEQCGADCRNVAYINEEVYGGLTLDDERIRQAMMEFRPKLVVIDPIQAYLGNDSDLQIAGRARRLMRRLGMWASVYDCAIVLIGHLNKKEGSKGLYRSLSSIDVVAAARSVLQVERDAEDSDIRIVRQIKNSLAPSDGEIRFSITAEAGFRWLECRTAKHPAQKAEPIQFESKTEKAAYLIKTLLERGDMRSKEVYIRLSDEGIGQRTAEVAKKELGVRCYRKMRQWYWSSYQRQKKKKRNEEAVMIMSEKQTAAVERKQRICDRYKGADTAEVEVIPAKPTEALEGKNTILRVAAYVRVSTDNDEQLTSYELQKNYYTDYISSHPGWVLAGIYAEM